MLKEIGSGSFSRVYRATHRLSGLDYALKRTRSPLTRDSERNRWLQVRVCVGGGRYSCLQLGQLGCLGTWLQLRGMLRLAACRALTPAAFRTLFPISGGAGARGRGGAPQHCAVLRRVGGAGHAGVSERGVLSSHDATLPTVVGHYCTRRAAAHVPLACCRSPAVPQSPQGTTCTLNLELCQESLGSSSLPPPHHTH